MKIAEIYKSIQGEGLLTGKASVFVRTSGCNLRCWFCDTPYASWHPEGQDLSVSEVIARCEEWDTRHIVLTGGEPMLFSELIPLSEQLRQQGRHITIETAGTLYLPVACDLMSISPKLANSTPSAEENPRRSIRHQRDRHVPEVIDRLIDHYEYQLKFVIDRIEDCEEVISYLEDFPKIDHNRVMLMPQATDLESLAKQQDWLEFYCQQNDFIFCNRYQLQWFGPVRGT